MLGTVGLTNEPNETCDLHILSHIICEIYFIPILHMGKQRLRKVKQTSQATQLGYLSEFKVHTCNCYLYLVVSQRPLNPSLALQCISWVTWGNPVYF